MVYVRQLVVVSALFRENAAQWRRLFACLREVSISLVDLAKRRGGPAPITRPAGVHKARSRPSVAAAARGARVAPELSALATIDCGRRCPRFLRVMVRPPAGERYRLSSALFVRHDAVVGAAGSRDAA